MTKNNIARAVRNAPVVITDLLLFSGSIKFGVTPVGGSKAGKFKIFSMPWGGVSPDMIDQNRWRELLRFIR